MKSYGQTNATYGTTNSPSWRKYHMIAIENRKLIHTCNLGERIKANLSWSHLLKTCHISGKGWWSQIIEWRFHENTLLIFSQLTTICEQQYGRNHVPWYARGVITSMRLRTKVSHRNNSGWPVSSQLDGAVGWLSNTLRLCDQENDHHSKRKREG